MIFQQRPGFGPVAQTRPLPRRGAFALESVDALPRLAERIAALAERSLESNPFFLPQFLDPAIRALGRGGLKLATFTDRDDLRFFAPVVTTPGRLLSGPKLAVWTHPYAPLGAPLIEREIAPQVADSLMKHLRLSGRTLLTISDLPLNGPTADCLRKAAKRRGFWTEAARQKRPILNLDRNEGACDFEQMATQKRRRELDRQLRRLCDSGAVSFMTARTVSEIESAFTMFISLEASGWKGRGGTALQRNKAIFDFARAAVMDLAVDGYAAIDVLRVGHKPVAALIRFDQGGLSIPWKIAYDETFAAYSPGRQLICDETRRWLASPAVTRVDPVCEQDNTLFSGLWPDTEVYGTLLLTTRSLGFGARMRAGMLNVRASTKRAAKILLRRPRRAKPKPAARVTKRAPQKPVKTVKKAARRTASEKRRQTK